MADDGDTVVTIKLKLDSGDTESAAKQAGEKAGDAFKKSFDSKAKGQGGAADGAKELAQAFQKALGDVDLGKALKLDAFKSQIQGVAQEAQKAGDSVKRSFEQPAAPRVPRMRPPTHEPPSAHEADMQRFERRVEGLNTIIETLSALMGGQGLLPTLLPYASLLGRRLAGVEGRESQEAETYLRRLGRIHPGGYRAAALGALEQEMDRPEPGAARAAGGAVLRQAEGQAIGQAAGKVLEGAIEKRSVAAATEGVAAKTGAAVVGGGAEAALTRAAEGVSAVTSSLGEAVTAAGTGAMIGGAIAELPGAAVGAGIGFLGKLLIGAGATGLGIIEIAKHTKEIGEGAADTAVEWDHMAKTMNMSHGELFSVRDLLAKSSIDIDLFNRSLTRLAIDTQHNMPEMRRAMEASNDAIVESDIKVAEAGRGVELSNIRRKDATYNLIKAQTEQRVAEETLGEQREEQMDRAQLSVRGAQLGIGGAQISMQGARIGLRRAQMGLGAAEVQMQFAPAEQAVQNIEGPLTVENAEMSLAGAKLGSWAAGIPLRQARGEIVPPDEQRRLQLATVSQAASAATLRVRNAEAAVQRARVEEGRRVTMEARGLGPVGQAAQQLQEAQQGVRQAGQGVAQAGLGIDTANLNLRESQLRLRQLDIRDKGISLEEELGEKRRNAMKAEIEDRAAEDDKRKADLGLRDAERAQQRELQSNRGRVLKTLRGEPGGADITTADEGALRDALLMRGLEKFGGGTKGTLAALSEAVLQIPEKDRPTAGLGVIRSVLPGLTSMRGGTMLEAQKELVDFITERSKEGRAPTEIFGGTEEERATGAEAAGKIFTPQRLEEARYQRSIRSQYEEEFRRSQLRLGTEPGVQRAATGIAGIEMTGATAINEALVGAAGAVQKFSDAVNKVVSQVSPEKEAVSGRKEKEEPASISGRAGPAREQFLERQRQSILQNAAETARKEADAARKEADAAAKAIEGKEPTLGMTRGQLQTLQRQREEADRLRKYAEEKETAKEKALAEARPKGALPGPPGPPSEVPPSPQSLLRTQQIPADIAGRMPTQPANTPSGMAASVTVAGGNVNVTGTVAISNLPAAAAPGAAAAAAPGAAAAPVTATEQAAGGLIRGPGTGTSDSIPILASNGEYIVRQSRVAQLGVPFLDALNSRRVRFNFGGLVTRQGGGSVDVPALRPEKDLLEAWIKLNGTEPDPAAWQAVLDAGLNPFEALDKDGKLTRDAVKRVAELAVVRRRPAGPTGPTVTTPTKPSLPDLYRPGSYLSKLLHLEPPYLGPMIGRQPGREETPSFPLPPHPGISFAPGREPVAKESDENIRLRIRQAGYNPDEWIVKRSPLAPDYVVNLYKPGGPGSATLGVALILKPAQMPGGPGGPGGEGFSTVGGKQVFLGALEDLKKNPGLIPQTTWYTSNGVGGLEEMVPGSTYGKYSQDTSSGKFGRVYRDRDGNWTNGLTTFFESPAKTRANIAEQQRRSAPIALPIPTPGAPVIPLPPPAPPRPLEAQPPGTTTPLPRPRPAEAALPTFPIPGSVEAAPPAPPEISPPSRLAEPTPSIEDIKDLRENVIPSLTPMPQPAPGRLGRPEEQEIPKDLPPPDLRDTPFRTGSINGGDDEGAWRGGLIRLAGGGLVPALVSNGEYRMSPEAVSHYGVGLFDRLNGGGGFAGGGSISFGPPAGFPSGFSPTPEPGLIGRISGAIRSAAVPIAMPRVVNDPMTGSHVQWGMGGVGGGIDPGIFQSLTGVQGPPAPVAAATHDLNLITSAGTFSVQTNADTLAAIQSSALGARLTSTGARPSWY